VNLVQGSNPSTVGDIQNPSRHRKKGSTKARLKNKNTNRDTNVKEFKDSDVEKPNSLRILFSGVFLTTENV
jgi:hypothetical protein